MRWHILRTLLHKEVLRHLANRGAIVLAILLQAIALLLSLGKAGSQGPILGGNVQRCYLIYKRSDPDLPHIKAWVQHLRSRIPSDWDENQLVVSAYERMRKDASGKILPPDNAGSIQIETMPGYTDGKHF